MILNLFLVALLIILTAFFVATEFAIIRIRPSRVDQMVVEEAEECPGCTKGDKQSGRLSLCLSIRHYNYCTRARMAWRADCGKAAAPSIREV